MSQAVATPIQRIREVLPTRLKRRLHFLTLFHQLRSIFIEVGELRLHLLDLHQHAREGLVALLRRGGHFEVVQHALAQQAELCLKLRRAFGFRQVVAAIAQHAAHLIELRKKRADALDDARRLGCILNLQSTDDGGEHLQLAARLRQCFFDLLRLCDFHQRRHTRLLLVDLFPIRVQRLRLEQESHAFSAQLITCLRDSLVHAINDGRVRVAHVAQRDDLAAQFTQRRQKLHESENVIRVGVRR